MRIIRDSIAIKVLIPTVLLFIISSFASFEFSKRTLKTTLKDEFVSKGHSLLKGLSSGIQDTLLNRDASTVQNFIDQYRDIAGVSFIMILDENHHVYAHTFYPKIPQEYLQLHEEEKTVVAGRGNQADYTEKIILGKRYLVIKTPILAGLLGHVYLGMGLEQREREVIAPLLYENLLINLIVIIVGVIIILLYTLYLLGPISTLTQFATKYASGERDHGELINKSFISRKDEVGQLAQALDRMLSVIKGHTDNLEGLVDERAQVIKQQQMQLLATSKLSALGEMAGGIAHEINNPLTVMLSRARIIQKIMKKDSIENSTIEKSVVVIFETIERIRKIVLGLRVVSRDSSAEKFDTSTLKEVLEDVINLSGEKFKAYGIQLIYNYDEVGMNTNFMCNRVQLSQVFINLFNNSFDEISDFSQKWLKFETSLNKRNITVKLTDSGNGISQEVQDKIFQPFFTTKEVGKGTGLGLSLSKSIILQHQGEFFIDNDSANTCFIIKLPITQEEKVS
ncbi:MAG: GHKL domain-containing protein [Bdellovibrionales bacterium]|jgi:signal transduction histidine kinase|nr:GHKL domain-containing protein [Bdellovibrionales bacterium]MBT3525680.1 GHKL domain-containing protein [Bdellovibrionales bacterium]MBT7767854.1 GHKL domain-containing protein [Bdellovibrionales bacterium]